MVDWLEQAVSFAGTLIAVFLGALFALWIARWQMRAERQAQEAYDHEHLIRSLELVAGELQDGEESAGLLLDVAYNAGMDLHAWDYYEAVATGLRTDAYDSLNRAGFLRRLPADVRRSLEEAFGVLWTIAALTPICRTRCDYEVAKGGNVKKALEIFLKVKLTAQEGLTTIPQARARLEGWLEAQKGSGG